jgi:hypothetical protein
MFTVSSLPPISNPENYRHLIRYVTFINSRPKRNLKKETGFNIHHIIPKSLGGADDNQNLIKLTYREHWIAHLMLWKSGYPEMISAFFFMNNKGSKSFYAGRLSSREFDQLTLEKIKRVSDYESNMRWITKNGKSYFIHQSQLQEYLNKGFELCRVMSDHWRVANKLGAKKGEQNGNFGGGNLSQEALESIGKSASIRNKNSLWINKEGINKFVTRDTLDGFLSQGWEIGRYGQKPTNTDEVLMHKGSEQKFISINDFDSFVAEGWKIGSVSKLSFHRGSRISQTVKKEGLHDTFPFRMKEGELF